MAKKRDYKAEATVYRKRVFQLLRISQPAVKLWQKEHGEPLTWPDLAKLIEWLTARCEIIPKRKSKVRRVPGTLAMEYDGYLSVYTNQKMPLNAIGAPCFVEIDEKYLKEKP